MRPSIISEHQQTAGFEELEHIPGHSLHLSGTDGGEHEDKGDDIETVGGEGGGLPLLITSHITHPGVTPAPGVLGVIPHQVHGRVGEVTANN